MSSEFYVLSVKLHYDNRVENAVIVDAVQQMYYIRPFWEEAHPLSDNEKIERAFARRDEHQQAFDTLQEAQKVAQDIELGGAHRAQLRTHNDMPLAWIAFTQILYVAILFSPGVRFVGSAYATVAQAAVALSAVMSNAPYLMTAARVSTAVAIGNLVLALLVWQSAYSIGDKIAAAYRAAIVAAVGFCIVCSNQYLTRISMWR